jgi:hypothetical protein
MKILTWILGVLMGLAVIVFGLQIIASETGEVVVLHTDDGGEEASTRLWIVDHDGDQWLRSGGGSDSGWYARLMAEPRVELTRDGVRGRYIAAIEPDMSEQVNTLMAQKYRWRDDIVAVLAGSRENGVAVRLTPPN